MGKRKLTCETHHQRKKGKKHADYGKHAVSAMPSETPSSSTTGVSSAMTSKASPMPKWQRDRLVRLNNAIATCARGKRANRARGIYDQILTEGLVPSAQTFGALVNAAVRIGDLPQARQWMAEAVQREIDPGVVTYTTLLKGYCEAGDMEEAKSILGQMSSSGCAPNLRTVNTLLRGCRRSGEIDLARTVFRDMGHRWDLTPDATSYEYICALLCQGLCTMTLRKVLKRLKLQFEGVNTGENSDEQNMVLQPLVLAQLWEMAAEASLLCGEPKKAKKAMQHASNFRKIATGSSQSIDSAASMSGTLFCEFKRRELESRSALLSEGLERLALEESSRKKHDSFLSAIRRLLILSDCTSTVTLDSLLGGLNRSFGLKILLRRVKPMSARRVARDALYSNFANIITSDGKLDVAKLFNTPSLPLKVELCSGDGEWVCAQAIADAGRANWICVELRCDRVFRTASRAFLSGVSNLCVVGGDAVVALRYLLPSSVSNVFVNFPEPPVRRGDASNSTVADSNYTEPPHLLTAATFQLIQRILVRKGSLMVHSDNLVYARQLAKSIDAVGGFKEKTPDSSESSMQEKQDGTLLGAIPIWRGRPGKSCGVPNGEASSFFDRLWQNGRFVKRHFVLVQRQS